EAGGDRATSLGPAGLVLNPAPRYPGYPIAPSPGEVPGQGPLFDVPRDCFPPQPPKHLDRFQTLRGHENSCICRPPQIAHLLGRGRRGAQGMAARLGLAYRVEQANDPFFGRGGKLMAATQIEQSLKFELLVPLRSAEQPTACMSFNYHQDHFGKTWSLRT